MKKILALFSVFSVVLTLGTTGIGHAEEDLTSSDAYIVSEEFGPNELNDLDITDPESGLAKPDDKDTSILEEQDGSDGNTELDETDVEDEPLDLEDGVDSGHEEVDEVVVDTESENLSEVVPDVNRATTISQGRIKAGSFSSAPLKNGASRLYGSSRYETAVEISKRLVPQSAIPDVADVFIASGASFADGLTIGALASYAGSPLLLTKKDSIPNAVRQEIARLRPTTIYIAGGTGAVNAGVAQQLGGINGAKVVRLGGKDRYETALAVAKEFPQGTPALLATGSVFPDATVAGAAAGKLGGAVVLTPGFKTGPATLAALTHLKPSSVHLVGGTWSKTELNKLSSAAKKSVAHYTGKDRYATSARVASALWKNSSRALYATGATFADSLAGVPAGKALNAPILLTPGGCKAIPVAEVTGNVSSHLSLGGKAVVADAAANTRCINPSRSAAAPSFSNGTYSFGMSWSGQQTNYWCGPAGTFSVLQRMGWGRAANGEGLTQYALAKRLETEAYGRTPWWRDSLPNGIRSWTGGAVSYRRYPHPNANEIKTLLDESFLKTGRPLILHEDLKSNMTPLNNQNRGTYTHVMVVNSYNPQTGRIQIIDPGGAGAVFPRAASSFSVHYSQLVPYLSGQGLYR